MKRIQWSKIKKKLDSMLCPALSGRITYHVTQYTDAHDDHGKAVIRVDGNDIFIASDLGVKDSRFMGTDEMQNLYADVYCEGYQEQVEYLEAHGIYEEYGFFREVFGFLRRPLHESLSSASILRNILALLDRRTGKRTLKKIQDAMENRHAAVQYFYRLRCQAEGIQTARPVEN